MNHGQRLETTPVGDLLPNAMAEDDFTRRFASIFELLWSDVRARVSGAGAYFDPSIAPLEFVRMLARWTNLPTSVETDWQSEHHIRGLVAVASPLFRWRGTRRGLEELLGYVTGSDVRVEDPGGVSIEGTESMEPMAGPVQIRLQGTPSTALTRGEMDVLVRAHMPVGVHYELIFEPAGGTDA